MQKRDQSFSQKIKDHAFYVALGLGIVAILAVVSIYTMQQSGGKLADNEQGVQTASEYLEQQDTEAVRRETSGLVQRENTTEAAKQYAAVDKESEGTEQEKVTTEQTEALTEEPEQLPVTADAGQLNFNSEQTISWPVKGSVLLPFSMETTVYFKTLDQYKCNPGMLISAGTGSTVQNVFLGQVTNVTSDEIYGNMVTLYLGNEYSVTYGQLDTIYVKEGDFVKAGESIGTIGNPTDSFTEEGSHLFFEMKQEDAPVDPVLFME